MAEKVRIGFVGAGYMGQNAHMANYAKIENCELPALAEGRAETAKAVAQKFGIPKIYPDHHALLEDESIDGVVAVMGFHLFNSLARDILNAGKPLITEKPIWHSTQQRAGTERACRRKRRTLPDRVYETA